MPATAGRVPMPAGNRWAQETPREERLENAKPIRLDENSGTCSALVDIESLTGRHPFLFDAQGDHFECAEGVRSLVFNRWVRPPGHTTVSAPGRSCHRKHKNFPEVFCEGVPRRVAPTHASILWGNRQASPRYFSVPARGACNIARTYLQH